MRPGARARRRARRVRHPAINSSDHAPAPGKALHTALKPRPGRRIEPSTVKREEYGTLIGTVVRISEFPISPQGMLAVLQNDNLVKQFSRDGSPYAAVARLEVDQQAVSGYRWAVGSGPPIRLTSGTLAKAEITTRKQRPLDLVVPIFKKLTGVAG